jgi:hypothetical protein
VHRRAVTASSREYGELANVNRLALIAALAVAACGGAPPRDGAGTSPGPDAGRVVVISVDGLMPDAYLEPDAHGLAIPTLRSVVARGAAARVHGVMPTVTYRSHTTLVTGVPPRVHGIVSNKPLDALDKNLDGWRWYAEDIAVPTLYQAVEAQHRVTALIVWPVTVGARASIVVPEYWRAICEGRSGVGPITRFDPKRLDARIAAEVKGFDPLKVIEKKELKKLDLFIQYAIAAGVEAVEDAKIDFSQVDPTRAGALVGSGIGGILSILEWHRVLLERGPSRVSPFFVPSLIVNMASGQLSIRYKLKGPNSAVVTACATGNHAIGDAFKIIQRGDADLMVAGGSEAIIDELPLGGFAQMKALSTRNDEPTRASRPFDADRDGFVAGEGAGVVVLESLEHARRRVRDIDLAFELIVLPDHRGIWKAPLRTIDHAS